MTRVIFAFAMLLGFALTGTVNATPRQGLVTKASQMQNGVVNPDTLDDDAEDDSDAEFAPPPAPAQQLPIWLEGAQDSGPMPPDANISIAILQVVYHCTENTGLYYCPLTVNGWRVASLGADFGIKVKRMDGKTMPVHAVKAGRNKVACDALQKGYEPANGMDNPDGKRTLRTTCTVNGVAYSIDFSLMFHGGTDV